MTVAQLRPAKAVVDLSALAYNIETIRKHLRPDQLFYAVVKADAYGHGAVPVAKKAEEVGVDGFCVAMLDEAIELREAGISKPILVLGVSEPEQAGTFVAYDVAATVSSLDYLEAVLADFRAKGVKGALKVHVALDTGMNRIGLESVDELAAIDSFLHEHGDQFIFDGVFTHFATADGENDNMVHRQYDRFENLLTGLKHGPNHLHLANSAMTLFRHHYPSEIVRVGIALYGYNPSDFVLDMPYALKRVMTLETKVVHKHLLKKGESVSYGAKYIAKQDEWVGTLPVGYADGWRREYAPSGVYIQGQKCDVLGVICMDQMMVRIPESVQLGDVVELLGDHQGASDLAVAVQTIGYEVLCGISPRIVRTYVDEPAS